MDVTLLDTTSLKIKSKKAIFIVDPNALIAKTEADAIISLNKFTDQKVVDHRVILSGPGEYEVNGVKLSGVKGNGSTAFTVYADGMEIFIGNASAASILGDKLKDHKIGIINADSDFSLSTINHLEASYIIIYGERANEWATKIEKPSERLNKVSFSADKLTEEVKIIILE